MVQSRLKINRKRQALFGHSLGGLFALHVLFTKLSSFQTYIAGSPSIWWKNRYLVKMADEFIRQKEQIHEENTVCSETSLLIAVGGREKLFMIQDALDMYKLLSSNTLPGLRLEYEYYELEGHVTLLPPLISRTLKFVLEHQEVRNSYI